MWRIIVGVISATTLYAGPALAECAWVLWEESEYSSNMGEVSKEWTLHVARKTQADCETVSANVWQVRLNHNQPGADKPGIKDVKSTPGYIIVNFKTGGAVSHTFRCLPDTVDPRGPKK